ncbi:MAG: hypothetical protein CBC05_02010 [Crocinitomicaceae bacterium TMED45]|nr:MAG: hypothetical protein CBC05_02010 [Crocinitomicaceae bacterium TMED45]
MIVSGDSDKSLRRVVLTNFTNEEEFTERYNEVAKLEKTKQILTGKEFDGGVFFLATNYEKNGQIPEKQMIEFIRNVSRKNKWSHYPSSNLRYNYKIEHLHQIGITEYWTGEMPLEEPDYVSMFIAIHKAVQMNELKTFLIDGENLSYFQEVLKGIIDPTFANPDIYITNKELTWDQIRTIERIKPKVVFLFGNSIIDYPKALHLMKHNIQIVPQSVTEIGNMLLSEGIYNSCRSVEESFQLINIACTELNVSLWKFVQNYRENMYNILDEIYQGHTDENATSKYKLSYKDIGAMSYRA